MKWAAYYENLFWFLIDLIESIRKMKKRGGRYSVIIFNELHFSEQPLILEHMLCEINEIFECLDINEWNIRIEWRAASTKCNDIYRIRYISKNHPFNNLELSAIAKFMSVQLPNCVVMFIKGVLICPTSIAMRIKSHWLLLIPACVKFMF